MAVDEEKLKWYRELEQYVLDYQNGDSEAADKIIRAFEGVIVKFTNLVCRGIIDPADKGLRNFVALFYPGSSGRKLHEYRFNSTACNELIEKAAFISKLFRDFEYDEIKNELIIIILNLARKYKPKGDGIPRFHIYVSKVFHFRAFGNLVKLISDPSFNSKRVSLEMYNFFQDEDIETAISKELDEIWTSGLTADIFANMLPVDRKIIKMYYFDKMSDEEIASFLGYTPTRVARRRRELVKELLDDLFS